MNADKNSDTEPDVIEGVAVEKPAKTRRRSASGAGGGMSESESGQTRQAASGTRSGGDAGSRGGGDTPNTSDISAGKRRAPVILTISVILAIIAIAVALAGTIFQHWTASRQEARLRAEIEALTVRVDAASETQSEQQVEAQTETEALMASLREERDATAARLAELEAAWQANPDRDIEALSLRLGALEDDLAARREAGGVSGVDPGRALALAGMSVAAAMNVANLDGGDPAQWLPALQETARAGLDMGDLERLQSLLVPRPAPPGRLLAEAEDLVEMMKRNPGEDVGWWRSTTDMLGGFVRLRRSDTDPMSDGEASGLLSPLEEFARAIRADGLAGALAASEEIAAPPAGLVEWQREARRRVNLDAELAALTARAAALLSDAVVGE